MPQLRVNKVRRISRLGVDRTPMTMGRSSQNDVVLPHTSVSREHCVIELIDGAPSLRDLGSRHGTRVNGQRIDDLTPLFDGDRIGVGPFEITYCDPTRGTRPSSDAAEATGDATMRRDEALRQLEQTIEQQRGMLAEHEQMLEQREADIREREQTLEEVRVRHEEAAGLLRADVGRLQAELTEMRQHREGAETELASEQHRSKELEAELAETQQAQTRLERLLDETRRRHDEHVERARADLDSKTRRLEESVALGASLKDRIAQLEQLHEIAARSCEKAEQSLRQLESAAVQLHQLSQRLTASQQTLDDLEAAWTEANEWLEQADRRDLATLRHLIQRRDAAGEQLETAHADRDQVIAELQRHIAELASLSRNERREWETVVRRSQSRSFLSGLARRFG